MIDQVKLELHQLIEQLPEGKLFQAKELLENLLPGTSPLASSLARPPSASTPARPPSAGILARPPSSSVPARPLQPKKQDPVIGFVKDAILDLNDGEIGFKDIEDDLGQLSIEVWPKYLQLLFSSEDLALGPKRMLLRGFLSKASKAQNTESLSECLAVFADLRTGAWEIAFEEFEIIFQRQFDSNEKIVEMREKLLDYAREALQITNNALILTVAKSLTELSRPDNKLVFVMSRPFKDIKLRKSVTDTLCLKLKQFTDEQWQSSFQILAQYPSSEITQTLYSSLNLDQNFPTQIQKNLLAYFRAHGTDKMFIRIATKIMEKDVISKEISHFLLILIKSSTIENPELVDSLKNITSKIATHADLELKNLALDILATKFK